MTRRPVENLPPSGTRIRPRAWRALALGPVLAATLSACGSLAPDYARPAAPVPAQFPFVQAPASSASSAAAAVSPASAASTAVPNWQAVVLDPEVRALVDLALANNRDLRVAALGVERSRAALRIANANRLPTLAAGVSATRAPSYVNGVETNTFEAGLTIPTYEIDLFGRLLSASQAARAELLASEYARRAARLAVITQTLSTAFILQSDEQQRALAQAQDASRREMLRLTQMRVDAGVASDLDLSTARTLAAQSQVALAQAERALAQDRDALALVLGQPVPAAFPKPAPMGASVSSNAAAASDATTAADQAADRIAAAPPPEALAPVPVALSSQVLLARPDVMQAEQTLVAANADIGVARAAIFPQLSLTASGGRVSGRLADLVSSGGTYAWTAAAQAALTLIDWGRNQANIKIAVVDRDVAIAQYEQTLQTAFREVADALAGLSTWRAQREAAEAQFDAESVRHRLTRLRYDNGAASLLDMLDSERSYAAAQLALVQTRQAELQNRVALYRALGGNESADAP